jgi:hypothetical protein
MGYFDGLTPLHLAVIENDVEAVTRLRNSSWIQSPDNLGFTPKELANLLGHRECQELLHSIISHVVKIQQKDEIDPKLLFINEFEKIFDVKYSSFLTFATYASLKEVVRNCPYLLRRATIAWDNHVLAERFKKQLSQGLTAKVVVKWINTDLGYGLFADEDLAPGAFIGEYTGLVRRLYRRRPDPNGYCFHYPTRFGSLKYFVIDALKEGNLLRFVNHSDRPNLLPFCAVDRGLLHTIFMTSHFVSKGKQLTIHYGDDYWIKRQKHDF